MPEEQDGAPEANQSKAAEMVELIREARTIVETGWPMPPVTNPETAVYEALQRANLVTGVIGMLAEASRRQTDPIAKWDHMFEMGEEANRRLQDHNDIVQLFLEQQQKLYDEIRAQTEAMGVVVESLKSIMALLAQAKIVAAQ